MPETFADECPSVSSVNDLSIGDAVYVESSFSTYWVVDIKEDKIVFETSDAREYSWIRETLQASIESHDWILQSRSPQARSDSADW